jgi:hypothetical protein
MELPISHLEKTAASLRETSYVKLPAERSTRLVKLPFGMIRCAVAAIVKQA